MDGAITAMDEARKQVLAGSFAASISMLVCHPIDVVRTELQVHSRVPSATICVKQIGELKSGSSGSIGRWSAFIDG